MPSAASSGRENLPPERRPTRRPRLDSTLSHPRQIPCSASLTTARSSPPSSFFSRFPGPGNLALITSTSKGGIRGGLAATFGVIAGDQVLMWAAVAGVAALLAAYPAAFKAVQWLGAAYLAWLGFKMLLAKPGAAPILNIRAAPVPPAGAA